MLTSDQVTDDKASSAIQSLPYVIYDRDGSVAHSAGSYELCEVLA